MTADTPRTTKNGQGAFPLWIRNTHGNTMSAAIRGLVNLFIADARRLWDKLGLFDAATAKRKRQSVDYTDRIVV